MITAPVEVEISVEELKTIYRASCRRSGRKPLVLTISSVAGSSSRRFWRDVEWHLTDRSNGEDTVDRRTVRTPDNEVVGVAAVVNVLIPRLRHGPSPRSAIDRLTSSGSWGGRCRGSQAHVH